MKLLIKLSGLTLLVASSCNAAYQEREYNTWYEKDAVLHDLTQTSDGRPVMISFSQAGFQTANMVISYMTEGKCPDGDIDLNINGDIVPAEYTCVQRGKEKIEHYRVRNADKTNALIAHLKGGFTLVIQQDIKVWAANIKAPRYGIGPRS